MRAVQGRVEEIPLDQLTINPTTEYLLPVGHFDKASLFVIVATFNQVRLFQEPSRMFGVPFFIEVIKRHKARASLPFEIASRRRSMCPTRSSRRYICASFAVF
jgi:hypothetical protein